MKVSLTRLWRKDAAKLRNDGASQNAVSNSAVSAVSAAPPLPVWPASGTAAMAWIDAPGTMRRASCRLQSRSDHELRLRIDQALGPDDLVWLVLDDGVNCSGKVLTCHPAGEFEREFDEKFNNEKFEVHIALMQASPAVTGISAAHLKWLDSSGVVAQEQVSLQSAEQGQLQVVLSQPLAVPSIVLLAGKGFQCLGAARRCEASAGRWGVAIQVLGDAYSRPRAQD
jgi:hypothetical protein